MRNYKNIKAFKLAHELVLEVYKITKEFPKEEIYGLTSQIRRAAVSIPANIVEGASRQHNKDYLNFLYNSRGSLAELEYLLSLATGLKYSNDKDFCSAEEKKQGVAKTLYGLIEAVKKEV
jgi:four helix bundle protein